MVIESARRRGTRVTLTAPLDLSPAAGGEGDGDDDDDAGEGDGDQAVQGTPRTENHDGRDA
jgi:hypothetical protein